MANKQQSRAHTEAARWTKRSDPHKEPAVGCSVQTNLALTVQLKRREHWQWEHLWGDRFQKYEVKLCPDVTNWLKSNKIKYQKSKKKRMCPRLKRAVWEIFLTFENNRDARRFILSWL